MAFEIEFDPEAVKDLKKLDRPVQRRLAGFLRLRVATLDSPRDIGEALAGGKLRAYWKYRVGDCRIICDDPGSSHRCPRPAHRQSARGLSIGRVGRII